MKETLKTLEECRTPTLERKIGQFRELMIEAVHAVRWDKDAEVGGVCQVVQ